MSFIPTPYRAALLIGMSTIALTMGACSGGDKSLSEEISVETVSLGLSGADEKALSQHFRIAPRTGSLASTEAALASFGLQPSDDLQVENREINGANVSYTNWRVETDDTVVTADTVNLFGLHEIDGQAHFDKMEVLNLVANGTEVGRFGDGTFRAEVDELVVVEPSPDLAQDLANVLRGRETDLTTGQPIPDVSAPQTFKALKMQAFDLRVTEQAASGEDKVGVANIGQIIIGNDHDSDTLDAVVEQVSLDWFGTGQASDSGTKLDMDGVTVLGLNMKNTGAMPGTPGLLAGGLSALSSPSLRAPYEQVDLGPLTLNNDVFDITVDGFEAKSTRRGQVTEIKSVLSPTLITLKDISQTPIAPYQDALGAHGFSEITLKGAQIMTLDAARDLVTVSDARTEIDGGLRLDCDYAITGTGAAQALVDESGLIPPDFSDVETEADMEAFFENMEAYRRVQNEANTLIKLTGLNCMVQDVADNSFVTRGYGMASAVTGSPIAVLKGSAKTMIALGSLTAPTQFQRDLLDDVGSGLIKFLDKPGQTMTVSMSPSEPVSLSALSGQPDEASLAALNLRVEVE